MNLEFGRPYHHKTIDQCRAIGRIGGLRSARNRKLRQPVQQAEPPSINRTPARETAHEASMLLDAKFPWLENAWALPVRRRVAMAAAGAQGATLAFSDRRC